MRWERRKLILRFAQTFPLLAAGFETVRGEKRINDASRGPYDAYLKKVPNFSRGSHTRRFRHRLPFGAYGQGCPFPALVLRGTARAYGSDTT